MKYLYYCDTKIGKLTIIEENEKIIKIDFGLTNYDDCEKKETKLINKTINQINEYLNGERKKFTIPINLITTPFRKKALEAVYNIPYGETASYGDIAKKINNEKASRAVGGANNKNPIPIIIPCHRVIGSNGKLVGYAGGLNIKEFLLDLEKNNK